MARFRRARWLYDVLGAALVYCGASVVMLGRQALADPSHVCACIGSGDPPSYMWGLRWWPYALTHGLNPLYSHAVWAPSGANVAAAPLIPLASLLLWPLTAAAGPLPAYDALTLLSPALAATSMYLLCLRITGRRAASLAGGWAFGLSSYELSQVVGHANLMQVALLPLAVLATLLALDGRLRRAWFVCAMTALIAAQVLTSLEVLATAIAFGALALVLAWLTAPAPKRRPIALVAAQVALAGLLAAVLTSPYLDYAAIRSHVHGTPGASENFVTDLAGLVVPTAVTLVRYAGSVAARLAGNIAEQGAYLGLPLLIAFLACLWERRRTAVAAILAGVAGVALLLSFGTHLTVAGHRSIPLPWALAIHLPLISAATPDRLIVYVWFCVAVAIALWLAAPARRPGVRWAVVLLGLVAIAPDGASPLFGTAPHVPALFSEGAYRRELPPHAVVLALPYGWRGDSMLWQAQADFAFTMPEGNLAGPDAVAGFASRSWRPCSRARPGPCRPRR